MKEMNRRPALQRNHTHTAHTLAIARSTMRPYLKKAAAVGFLAFLVLWIVGVASGLTLQHPPVPPMPIVSLSGGEREYFANSNSQQLANNIRQIKELAQTELPLVLDSPNVDQIRIFEKRATLTSTTFKFDNEEAAIRAAIKSQQADVFNEKSTGIAAHRRLMIEIGVSPEKFDGLVEKLRKIANVTSISVEQKDRTTEFRKLYAQRQSVKSYLEAMSGLRAAKTLTFDESLRLEQKIQDLEKELQTLSVQFGDLLGRESYYHVHVTLVEQQPRDENIKVDTISGRIYHGFVWAVAWWFAAALVVGLVGAAGASVWVLREKVDG
jgi:uncharacterized protein YfcZ (UPF0381/DUF406 family)